MDFKAAILIFSILFALILLNTVFINKSVSEISSLLNESPCDNIEDIEKLYKSVYEIYKKKELIISLSVSHEDLTDIEIFFSEMKGAITAKDFEEAMIAKSCLENALHHLGQLSSFNIESIF